jgi:hypothetical protein
LRTTGGGAMRKLGVWGVAAGLALGLAGAAVADDPGDSPGWRLFGSSKADEKKKEDERAALRAQELRKKAAVKRALDDVIRRMAVADRLMQLASEANDQLALKVAGELHDRAWQIYLRQTNQPTASAAGGFLATGFERGDNVLPQLSSKRGSAGREMP